MGTIKLFGVFISFLLFQDLVSGQVCTDPTNCLTTTTTAGNMFSLSQENYAGPHFTVEVQAAVEAILNLNCAAPNSTASFLQVVLKLDETALSADGTTALGQVDVGIISSTELKAVTFLRVGGTIQVFSGTDINTTPVITAQDPCVGALDGLDLDGDAMWYYYKDPCYYKPCYNGGICRYSYGSTPYCICPDYAKGDYCEKGPEALTTISVCEDCVTTLKCDAGAKIWIKDANFGRSDTKEQAMAYQQGCYGFDCTDDVTYDVRQECYQTDDWTFTGTQCTLYANQFGSYQDCPGPRFLTVTYLCARKKITCEDGNGWFGCTEEGTSIKVAKAEWGPSDKLDCYPTVASSATCQRASVRNRVMSVCEHQPQCDVPTNQGFIVADPCQYATGKNVLKILYGCVKKPCAVDKNIFVIGGGPGPR